MFDKELAYFIAHQEELVERFRGTILVLRGEQVVGAYPTPLEAFVAARQRFPEGTFMLQPCEPGVNAYTATISPTS